MTKKMMIPLILVLLITMVALPVFAADVDLDFDINSGIITILHTGEDASTFHPGQVGQSNYFTASGDVIGTYDSLDASTVGGTFGGLHTTINAYTDQGGGTFTVTDYQDFNVLSGTHIYDVEGYFAAGASGSYAAINMDIHPSSYVWSEHDSGGPVLVGQSIYKHSWVTQDDVSQGEIYIGMTTTGQAQMWNDAQWGFGIWETGSVSADYSSALNLNHLSATGTGTYLQTAFGNDYLEFNGIILNSGGSASIFGGFTEGYTGTYTMSGN